MTLDRLPILGVCGWSGSGKTTLIEATIPWLCHQGLKVAVIKHDTHRIDVDCPGKDSYRFFQAGSDVFLGNTEEHLVRQHCDTSVGLQELALSLCRRYDVILVEGHKDTPLAKVWLLSEDGEGNIPKTISGVVATLERGEDRAGAFQSFLQKWLPQQWLNTPVFGAVLIGGKSSRMGSPKHLIRQNGKTWLERTVELLRPVTCQIAVLGAGQIPDDLSDRVQLPDVPDAEGPMAGVLAAMRWAPQASWLVVGCDYPHLSREAIDWLLSTRRPGVLATLPRPDAQQPIEPLLAHYDFRARALIENLAGRQELSLARLAANAKVITPAPPARLAMAWQDVDTPQTLP